MFPRTIPGRALIFLLCIWGVFMISLMVVALTSKVILSVPETKGLQIYMRLASYEIYKRAAVEVIQNLLKYHTYNKADGKLKNISKAKRALKRLISATKNLQEARRTFDNYKMKFITQDDLITTIEKLHKEMLSMKKVQLSIIEKNQFI
jgi:hypothetical protein